MSIISIRFTFLLYYSYSEGSMTFAMLQQRGGANVYVRSYDQCRTFALLEVECTSPGVLVCSCSLDYILIVLIPPIVYCFFP